MSQLAYIVLWNKPLEHIAAYLVFLNSDAFCTILDQTYFIIYKPVYGIKA